METVQAHNFDIEKSNCLTKLSVREVDGVVNEVDSKAVTSQLPEHSVYGVRVRHKAGNRAVRRHPASVLGTWHQHS